MAMTRQGPEFITLPDTDDASPLSHPLHSPAPFPSPNSYPIQGYGLLSSDNPPFAVPLSYPSEVFNAAPLEGMLPDASHMAGMPEEGYPVSHANNHPRYVRPSYRGVSYSNGRWQARVMMQGRWVYCETFDSQEAAAMAYDRAIRQLNPDEAERFVNFPTGGAHVHGANAVPTPRPQVQSWRVLGDVNDIGQRASVGMPVQRAWRPHTAAPSHVQHHQMHPVRPQYTGMMPGLQVMSPIVSAPVATEDAARVPHGPGMFKSPSVSTLMAQTTLSSSPPMSAVEVSPLMQWPVSAEMASAPFAAPVATIPVQQDVGDMSAASLLLGVDTGAPPSATALKRVPSGVAKEGCFPAPHNPVQMAESCGHVHVAQARSPSPRNTDTGNSGGTVGSGGGGVGSGCSGSGVRTGVLGIAEGGVRRVGSAQELASVVSRQSWSSRNASGGARSTRMASTRASNRRVNSRYAKEDAQDESDKGRKAGAKGGPAIEQPPQTEEELHAEKLREANALNAGLERLHEQMRAHQAEHEEKQRKTAQHEADKAQKKLSTQLAAVGSPTTGGSNSPMVTNVHKGSPDEGSGGAGMPKRRSNPHGALGYPPTSETSTGSGGKAPRRVPSEPHSLATMGVAFMGGRHSPTTRPMSGMRRVKSTHNFGYHHQYAVPMHSQNVSMPMSAETLRPSPSMPAFPSTIEQASNTHRLDSLETSLPNISEEREDAAKIPESVTSMLLGDQEQDQQGPDDLFSLIKDLEDTTGMDLELGIPGNDAPRPGGVQSLPGNSFARNQLYQPQGMTGHVDDQLESSAGRSGTQHPNPAAVNDVSDIDQLFNIDGSDQMALPMLDD